MSSTPPTPPAEPEVLPWERRTGVDPVHAFVESVRRIAFAPDDAWRVTPESGGFESPLLFGLIVSFIGAAIGFIYRWIFVSPFTRMIPPEVFRRWGAMPWWFAGRQRFGCGLLLWPLVAAIAIVIGLFVVSAVLHLFALIVGATRTSTSGFEGTFRAVAYSSVAGLARIIPFLGVPISIVWWIVLVIKGLTRMHRTTTGRAAAAVFLPVVICCVCLFALIVLVFGMMFALGRHGTRY